MLAAPFLAVPLLAIGDVVLDRPSSRTVLRLLGPGLLAFAIISGFSIGLFILPAALAATASAGLSFGGGEAARPGNNPTPGRVQPIRSRLRPGPPMRTAFDQLHAARLHHRSLGMALVGLVLTAALLLAGCGDGRARATTTAVPATAAASTSPLATGNSYAAAAAGQLAEHFSSVEEIARSADVIVVGRVRASSNVPFRGVPFTVQTVEVVAAIKGTSTPAELTVVETGGTWAGRSKVEPGAIGQAREVGFEGVPVMKPGEDYLLFLRGPAHVGPVPEGAYSVAGVVQGKLRVGRDGKLGFPGGNLANPMFAVPAALSGMTLEEARAAIEQALR